MEREVVDTFSREMDANNNYGVEERSVCIKNPNTHLRVTIYTRFVNVGILFLKPDILTKAGKKKKIVINETAE